MVVPNTVRGANSEFVSIELVQRNRNELPVLTDEESCAFEFELRS